jgi:hypothetical protein
MRGLGKDGFSARMLMVVELLYKLIHPVKDGKGFNAFS